ncbi:MAG: M81 family metallopeptidase [SAR324 cluster bacterium]|nr:M81 family metallopeptidase [SAR324 cluster bacterium]
MRLILASMKHETNTFSPVPTGLERFAERVLCFDAEVPETFRGTRTGLGAFLDLAREAGAEIVTPVAAEASPSAPVAAQAYARITDAICEAVAGGADGIMLDLHGAMVAESTPDGEGSLLERVRALAPQTPICVNLDLHSNLSEAMVRNCDAMIGYKTYPHVDSYETALQIGRVLLRTLQGEVRPVMAWGNRPLLAQTLRMGHEDEPMKSLLALAVDAEQEPGLLAATVFGGFPLADIHDAGLSAVVVADGNADQAEAVKERLLNACWEQREEFIYRGEPLHEAIARAKKLKEGPVILLDHADNTASGGTQDVMTVIAEVLSQELEDVAVHAVRDPQAVQEMIAAGVGAQVTIDLGGKMDMPSIKRRGESLRVTGRVRSITDGDYVVTGPKNTGMTEHMGASAVLDTGKVQIVVVSYSNEPFDLGAFTSVGIDPRRKKYLLLKSRIHYRAGFASIARHTITCDGIGVTSSDNSLFTFEHVRRPIFPLDAMEDN